MHSSFILLYYTVDFERIHVDIHSPERNGPVIVQSFTDVEVNGILHNGFMLLLHVEMEDYVSDRFQARLVSSNEVLIRMPSVPNSWLKNMDPFFAFLDEVGESCNRTVLGHQVASNAIAGDTERQTKHLLLTFPESIVLDSRHYVLDDNQELQHTCVPIDTDNTVQGQQFNRTRDLLFGK